MKRFEARDMRNLFHEVTTVVMLKYRKNLVSVSILLQKVTIIVPYNITIQEISDKLKKFFERNVGNVFETLTYKFLKYFVNNFVKLTEKCGSLFRNRYIGENMN